VISCLLVSLPFTQLLALAKGLILASGRVARLIQVLSFFWDPVTRSTKGGRKSPVSLARPSSLSQAPAELQLAMDVCVSLIHPQSCTAGLPTHEESQLTTLNSKPVGLGVQFQQQLFSTEVMRGAKSVQN
jgi:hypothetical protein